MLEEHPDALKEMARRFRVSPERLRANLRRQTQAPIEGTYFRNTEGTAVGLVFERADDVIVALPGPPRELQAMVRNELVPYLSRRFGTRLPGCSLMLRFVGLGQSQIDQTLEDNVPIAPDITVSSQFDGSRVDFTFSLPEDTPQDRARLQELKQKIMKHLGENIYTDDEMSLEEHVLNLLKARGETLALAEAGSGGALTAALSKTDEAEQILAGAFIAPTTEKLSDLLSMQNNNQTDISQLATAVTNATSSQWAIAVGQANSSGYVEVAFKLPDGRLENRKFRLHGSGELARSRLSTQLLDHLRRRLK
ncbi:MAG: CinA family protein [Planctomycetota bacterium]|jgi:nicotinamide-nucleotide amidase